jgi:DNA-binding transcriptional LysR family regulator
MDLKRLRTFVAVAEQGTVSKAATLLRITQPALSRQIIDLQGELGVALFRRAGRRLVLTEEGEQLLGQSRAVLAHADLLAERMRSIGQGDAGILRVAAAPQTIENVLPGFLHRYARRYPGVKVKLIEAVAFDQLQLLERGEAQLAINVAQAHDGRFASHPLPPLEVLTVWDRSFPLRKSSVIDIRALVRCPLLLPKAGFASRKLFDAACRLEHLEPVVMVESDAPNALIALAKAGHGVAVIPSTVLVDRKRLHVARLACRRKLLQTERAVLCDRRRSLPHYAEGFCQLLAAHMREIFSSAPPAGPKGGARRASALTP